MKKKFEVPPKDKRDWNTFTEQMGDVSPKNVDLVESNILLKEIPKLDLHGLSLEKAHEKTEKFIIESFNNKYKKVLIVTGKGKRSKAHENPYISEKLSILKYSVPDYIRNNKNLASKINKITDASLKEGGEGAIYIFFKNNKNL